MNLSAPHSMRPAQSLTCPRCQGPVSVGSRHISVAGTAVLVYCSAACLRGLGDLYPLDLAEAAPRRARWWIAAGILVGGTFVVVQNVDREPPPPRPAIVAVAPKHAAAALPVAAPARPTPEEEAAAAQAAQDEALLHELMQDAWIHPLAGPKRRMPVNHTAAFGAERQVDPRPECVSGHCGVDVGSDWGEPVHAVHDGVVDWVNRGPNEEHGGVFVKIAHRGSSLYSWYFHLAAVPRWVQPGVKIAVGQVIGLLGDTGIKRSVPHLHFAMTVKPPGNGRERYIDPEPLIAIWPLWILEDGNGNGKGHMSTAEAPGVPVRAPPPRGRTRTARASSPLSAGGAAQNDNQAAPEPPGSASGVTTPIVSPAAAGVRAAASAAASEAR